MKKIHLIESQAGLTPLERDYERTICALLNGSYLSMLANRDYALMSNEDWTQYTVVKASLMRHIRKLTNIKKNEDGRWVL